ncbi:hypothetical protein GDO81_023746 [Engystomops pustulosus]|uniref:Frog antimicrobial peptide propeptide domain-containing protein n=1 Tax=Engystomops pustulosus TaxID=76066 RepID=A0AAV6YP41_ENGPU|nr:hypothetical protein GDO81_023746 [Engystomops pustulosus]
MTFLKKSLFLVLFLGLVSLAICEEEEKREEEEEEDEEKREDDGKIEEKRTMPLGWYEALKEMGINIDK